jgi:hypothetical protein
MLQKLSDDELTAEASADDIDEYIRHWLWLLHWGHSCLLCSTHKVATLSTYFSQNVPYHC